MKITIDKQTIEIDKPMSVLEAARQVGIKIPTLCYYEDLPPVGSCGVCVVDIEGLGVKRACVTPVYDGMNISTHSQRVIKHRKMAIELMLSDHPLDCLTCERSGRCDLQTLAENLGITDVRYPRLKYKEKELDNTSPSLVRDPNKCIRCKRCVQMCENIQSVEAIDVMGRGYETTVTVAYDNGMGNSSCVNCGQCISVCPVGAIYEKRDIDLVWEAINNPDKFVVVQEAPAVRVSLAEEFGLDVGDDATGKMYTALRMLGFDAIFDTNFAADLTIMEEGTELLNRVKEGGPFPLITSCSPGWIKFMETFYPDMKENTSSCKSPQQMFGAMVKTYFAKKNNIDPRRIISVSVMPCTAKKFEALRPEMNASGYRDVDYVLTTRELVRMIKEVGIDFANLPETSADTLMGAYTGAAVIFGATGGVMEAALRSAYELYTGKTLPKLDFEKVRGMEGVRETSVDLNGLEVKVAVAHGLDNAGTLLDKVNEYKKKHKGQSPYHFIEVMTCPGGCVGGGGQPYGSTMGKRQQRAQGLYSIDRNLKMRKSHENPSVKKAYEEFLGEPNSKLAHKLLHTHYVRRKY